jgi:diadenosine tetraphosphate (Ap4A) HIT family hydrolase
VPGHTLVVPNRHAASLAEVDAESYWRVFEVGRQVAGALRASRLRVDGVLFWVSDGDAAGQEIFHMHLHVVPRFPGDGFEIRIAAYEDPLPARPLLDRHAVMLRTAFES